MGKKELKAVVKEMGLFVTPNNQEQIMNFIEKLPNQERAGAVTVFGMTWNYFAKLINNDFNVDEKGNIND